MRIRTQLAAIAAVAVLGSLAACGGGDDKAAESPAAPATSTDTAPAAGTGTKPAAGGETITMTDNVFTPAKLTVAPGTKITVLNKGVALHDLTDNKKVNSGDINGGASGSVTAPSAPGEYPYKCTYHVGMDGVLTVK